MTKVRVRFAPSPTGPLHIGGVRTALYNYLFAKKHGGDFILRIEDTDQARFVAGAEDYIVESLKWCGIEPDESVQKGGQFGPYKQSERSKIYKQFVEQLIKDDKAYYAFDTPEELDALRKEAENEKTPFVYNFRSREKLNNSISLKDSECKNLLDTDTPFVVRFKTPVDKELVISDLVRGEIHFNSNETDDKVLFKSGGLPTYHLANIVDDHLMEISHVIRGEEWLPSLPLHIMLYEALGWQAPEFAHLPLILKPEGKGKLSKRDGDKLGFPVFPIEYKTPEGDSFRGFREDGYLPDAFFYLLAVLGWNPGDERELLSMKELIEAFSIERVGKSGSRFSPDKAKWFNQQYLHKMSDEELAGLFEIELQSQGIDAPHEFNVKICKLLKDRLGFVSELWYESYFFYKRPDTYDEKFVKKAWKENTSEIMGYLSDLLSEIEDFTSVNLETRVKEMVEAKELGLGKVMTPFRLSLVGTGKGPHVFDIAEIIGKEETIGRIKKAVEELG